MNKVDEAKVHEGRPPSSPEVEPADAAATLAAWRERGAQRHDPVRFRFIEALARRAAAHDGQARQVLDGKLAQALQAYGARLDNAEAGAAAGHAAGAEARAGSAPDGVAAGSPGPLTDLLRHIAAGVPVTIAAGVATGLAADTAPTGELKALSHFRSTWSRLSADRRLSQSRAKVPGNAGPLHSHALVLRSLTLMRELSPEYLGHFMSHIDALLWLEQANGGHAAAPQDVVRGEGDNKPRKPTRGRSA